MAYSIEITTNNIPQLEKMFAQLKAGEEKPVVGRAASNLTREHLLAYDGSHPNRLGGKRTHFYGQAARSVSYAVVPEGVAMSVSHVGIRQRLEGGLILPGRNESHFALSKLRPAAGPAGPTKYLTIPAIAEAYGKRAGKFSNLTVLWGRNGPYALAEKIQKRSAGKRGNPKKGESFYVSRGELKIASGGRIYYWLTKRVDQKGDRNVIPTEQQYVSAIGESLEGYLVSLSKFGKQ